MALLNEKLKMITCSDFRIFLKKMIKDKIEKEWTENFVENLNLVMVSRNTIKRRYEDKGIDLIKLINEAMRIFQIRMGQLVQRDLLVLFLN